MRHILTILIVAYSIISTQAQQYQLVPKHSSVEWTGYAEVGNYTQSGSLNCKEGSFELKEGLITSGKIVMDMKSISHSDRTLEKHLKADDFFDVKKYPTATFQILSGTTTSVNGILTMHGISKEISMIIDIKEDIERITVIGQMSIDRTQFDIKYNSSSYFQDLGNYAIKNEFDLSVSLVFKLE